MDRRKFLKATAGTAVACGSVAFTLPSLGKPGTPGVSGETMWPPEVSYAQRSVKIERGAMEYHALAQQIKKFYRQYEDCDQVLCVVEKNAHQLVVNFTAVHP